MIDRYLARYSNLGIRKLITREVGGRIRSLLPGRGGNRYVTSVGVWGADIGADRVPRASLGRLPEQDQENPMFIRKYNNRFATPRPDSALVEALSAPHADLSRLSVGARILDLNEQIRSAASVGDDLATYAARRERDRLQAAVAAAYGLVRGWRPRARPFSLVELALGRFIRLNQPHAVARDPLAADAPAGLFDHQSYWVQGGPAAVVTQPYGVTAKFRQEVVAWGAQQGLHVTFPTDFPSWHLPTMTTLIEITNGS